MVKPPQAESVAGLLFRALAHLLAGQKIIRELDRKLTEIALALLLFLSFSDRRLFG